MSVNEEAYFKVLTFITRFVGSACILALAIVACEKYQDCNTPRTPIHSQSLTDRDYALEHLGEGSVYQSFLGTSKGGWLIITDTMVIQILILSIFVGASKKDFDCKVDMVYTWKYTRDQEACFDTSYLDVKGWLAFAILMIAHLLKDGSNRLKMIKHSANKRHGRNVWVRLFIGGTLMLGGTEA
jgi:hypothetical protein